MAQWINRRMKLDFRLPPPCWWDLRSSGILRSVVGLLFNDVWGPNYRPQFQGSEVVGCWPLKMGRIRCSETSVNNYHMTPRKIPEERRYQVYEYSRLLGYYAVRTGICECLPVCWASLDCIAATVWNVGNCEGFLIFSSNKNTLHFSVPPSHCFPT
jgi:hypothetical protein